MAVKVRNTVVNGGMSGIAPEIGKIFSFKKGQNHSTMKRAGAVNDRKSTAQIAVRNEFAMRSVGWSLLTEAQRQMWVNEAPNWVNEGVYGETKPSGKNLYSGCNVALKAVGNTNGILEPASKSLFAEIDGAVVAPFGNDQIVLQATLNQVSSDDYISVSVSSMQTAGTSKCSKKVILFSSELSGDINQTLDVAYKFKFGNFQTGKKVFYTISTVSSGGKVSKYSEGHIILQ